MLGEAFWQLTVAHVNLSLGLTAPLYQTYAIGLVMAQFYVLTWEDNTPIWINTNPRKAGVFKLKKKCHAEGWSRWIRHTGMFTEALLQDFFFLWFLCLCVCDNNEFDNSSIAVLHVFIGCAASQLPCFCSTRHTHPSPQVQQKHLLEGRHD